MELKKCPMCGSKSIVWIQTAFVVTVRGRKKRIPRIRRQKCGNCGEEYFDTKANQSLDLYRGKRRHTSSKVV